MKERPKNRFIKAMMLCRKPNPNRKRQFPRKKPRIYPSQRSYQPVATANALGCLFDIRSVRVSKDGIQVRLEVINTDADVRSVAFYDERFGNWAKSMIYDEADKYYVTAQAYVIQDNKKTLMYDIDRRGRGIAIEPNKSVSMELNFTDVPANVRTVKINLHPFIYYRRGWGQTWQEFDLPLPGIRLYTEAQSSKPAAAAATKATAAPNAAKAPATISTTVTTPAESAAPAKAKTDKKKKSTPEENSPAREGIKLTKHLLIFTVFFFICWGTAQADFYKWEDENGNIHITDYPPPAKSGKKIQVHKYNSTCPEKKISQWINKRS